MRKLLSPGGGLVLASAGTGRVFVVVYAAPEPVCIVAVDEGSRPSQTSSMTERFPKTVA